MGRIAGAAVAVWLAAAASACGGGSDGPSRNALPDDFPVYEGAALVDSGSATGEGESGGRAIYRTDDDAETVRRFFESELADDGWTVETETRGEDIVIRIQNPDDPAESGSIVIREEDGRTQIVETVGRDDDPDDDDDDDSGSGGRPEQTPVVGADGLPVGYPSASVPLPAGITVTTATGPVEQGLNVYSVEFDVEAPVDSIVRHFVTQLASRGWALDQDRQDSPFTLHFSGPDGSVLVTGFGDETATHANVTITME